VPITLINLDKVYPGYILDLTSMHKNVLLQQQGVGENVTLDKCPMCGRLGRAMEDYSYYLHKIKVALSGEPEIYDACHHSTRAINEADHMCRENILPISPRYCDPEVWVILKARKHV